MKRDQLDAADAAQQRQARSRRANGKHVLWGMRRTGSRGARHEADITVPVGEKGNEAESRVGWVLEASTSSCRWG